METIIQGSNDPIILIVEELSSFTKLSAMLISCGKVKKEWTLSDVSVEDDYLILPLTEDDTLGLAEGQVTLDIKGIKNGYIEFLEMVNFVVARRYNKKKMVEVNNDNNM